MRDKTLRAICSAFVLLAWLAALPARAATITIVNLDGAGEGFNDPTPAAPVGGNPGATVGAQRLQVFQRAAQYWGARLVSSVSIQVGASFDPLSCTASIGTLGSAGPVNVFRDFTGAPRASTYYPSALANALAGTDLDPFQRDISATFNSNVGQAGCLESVSWYYGLDHNAPFNGVDLLDVLLHELAHGLGVISEVSLSTGARLNGFNDTFMLNLEDHGTGKTYGLMTDAERVAASINSGNLHWVGTNVIAKSGLLSFGASTNGHVRMYAPNPQESGSSVSHFDSALFPNELMEPFLNSSSDDRLTAALLRDIGWTVLPPAPAIATNGLALVAENCAPANGGIDPGEMVTLDLTLKNNGTADTTNLTAALLATGGVTAPGAPQNYGALIAGASVVARSFSFIATGACGANLTLTLQLSDGAASLGTVSFTARLGASVSFTNLTAISIPNSGNASPSPSAITVSGVSGTARNVVVRLMNFTHSNPDDLDILLVGPGGQTVLLMSDAGGATNLTGATLAFDDNAAASLPDSSAISSGTYRPTNFGTGDTFAVSAPAAPYGTMLAAFNGTDPNGEWQLFVVDDAAPRSGSIGSWSLTFSQCCAGNQPPVISNPTNRTVVEESLLAFTVVASDPESQALTYALAPGTPEGASINSTNGLFTWSPAESQGPGIFDVIVVVSDDGTPPLTNSAGFAITVTESNQPPQLSPLNNLVVHAGSSVSFVAGATDPDLPAGQFNFSLAPGALANATLDAATGHFLWLATDDLTGTTNSFLLCVSDDGVPPLASSNSFSVVVVSRPAFLEVALTNGSIAMSWSAIAGQAYRVECKTNLIDTAWSEVPGDVIAAGAGATKTDSLTNGLQKFYRIKVLP